MFYDYEILIVQNNFTNFIEEKQDNVHRQLDYGVFWVKQEVQTNQ